MRRNCDAQQQVFSDMEHGQAISHSAKTDPGDFVAEEQRIAKAKPNYIGVFLFLGVLTAIEVGITVVFPHREGVAVTGTVPILLFLTVAKALLVILYYMHLKFDSRIYTFFFGAGVLAFAVPFVISMIFLMSPPELVSQRHGGENGGEPGEVRPTPNPNAGPPVTLKLDGAEFEFIPDKLSANSGQVVRIELKNIGSVEHNFVMPSKPVTELAEPWVTNDGKLIAKAGPATTGRGSFTAPGSGDYAFYCNIPGHAATGMHGIITIR